MYSKHSSDYVAFVCSYVKLPLPQSQRSSCPVLAGPSLRDQRTRNQSKVDIMRRKPVISVNPSFIVPTGPPALLKQYSIFKSRYWVKTFIIICLLARMDVTLRYSDNFILLCKNFNL